MLQFTCDWCHRIKRADEAWILGFAADMEGAVSQRRELLIAEHWAPTCHPLAVHFCSEEHKEQYIRKMFGGAASNRPRLQRRKGEPAARRTSAGIAATTVRPATPGRKQHTNTKPKRRIGATRLSVSKADKLRAHALGVCV